MVRQAAFKGLREDKPAEEVKSRAAGRSALTIELVTPRLRRKRGSPSKAARCLSWASPFPSPTRRSGRLRRWRAVTKLDLARYLEKVGPWMIEDLEGSSMFHHSCARWHSTTRNSSSAMPCRAYPISSS